MLKLIQKGPTVCTTEFGSELGLFKQISFSHRCCYVNYESLFYQFCIVNKLSLTNPPGVTIFRFYANIRVLHGLCVFK